MASIVTNLTCELTTPVSVVFLPGNMFSMDNGGNIINVFVVQNGEPATLGGSVSANVIRSDGTTVAITGALEGNKAYIILPQACYAVPGIIHIVMKITEGTTITTIAAITANVYQSSTDAIVDPGTLVPSVAALIAQIEAAVDSIPVDYSGLLATIAADYSSSKTYKVGDYAWESGVLKRCIVPITAAETYTAAHWTNAVIGDDLSALKSAIQLSVIGKATITANRTLSGYVDYEGGYHTNSAYRSVEYIVDDKFVGVTATGANSATATSPKKIALLSCLDAQDNVIGVGGIIESNDTTTHTVRIDIPLGTTRVLVCVGKDYIDSNGTPVTVFDVVESIQNRATKEETIKGNNIAPEYLSHRYLNSNGTPTSSTSNNWNLYKLDVSGIDDVDLTTYCNGGSKPMWAFYTVEYANADVTAMQNSENIVAVGENYEVDGEISKYIHVPTGAKTMSIVCYASQYTHLAVTTYAFGEARAFVQMPIRVKDLEDNAYRYIGSVYYRNVRWGCPSFENYYHSEDNGTSEFLSSTTAEQYFGKLNALVEDYVGYAESHEMGIASDESTMMYYYTFNPLTSQDSATYKRPKIIISAGQHGFEKTACFGLYWFIRNLLEDWQNNPFLSYVRNHVQLVIMPLLNPWGFDNDKYVNANGVNLNRNWDTTGWSSGTEGTTSYGGAEPLDQPETQYASEVILANLDALWLCDYHNNGQTAPGSAAGYLWHSFALVTYDDPYFKNAIDAAKWHIDETTGHLYVDYPDNCQYAVSGAWTDNNAPSHQGLIVAYAREHNIMAATMEGGAAFIDSGNRYSSPIHHMNADLIGNWIRCLLATFSHYAE